jgi:hypothetical protein
MSKIVILQYYVRFMATGSVRAFCLLPKLVSTKISVRAAHHTLCIVQPVVTVPASYIFARNHRVSSSRDPAAFDIVPKIYYTISIEDAVGDGKDSHVLHIEWLFVVVSGTYLAITTKLNSCLHRMRECSTKANC